MKTTTELLDEVKARYGLPSDYALAAKLGMTRAGISGYRTGRTKLSGAIALRVAELLDLNPGYVLASMEAERTRNEAERAAWTKLANLVKHHGAVAALLILAAVPSLAPTPSNAAPLKAGAGVCILCKLRRALDYVRSIWPGMSRYSGFFHEAIPA